MTHNGHQLSDYFSQKKYRMLKKYNGFWNVDELVDNGH